MHLLAAQPGAITDGEEAVDLGQSPGEIVYISAADTELALIADVLSALADEGAEMPSIRLANFMQLGLTICLSIFMSMKLCSMRSWWSRACARRCWILALWG